jgi:GDPmannose 4,6-dehydratase
LVRYFRPSEVDNLRGSAAKAKEDADLEKAKREKVLVDAGFMDSHQQP